MVFECWDTVAGGDPTLNHFCFNSSCFPGSHHLYFEVEARNDGLWLQWQVNTIIGSAVGNVGNLLAP